MSYMGTVSSGSVCGAFPSTPLVSTWSCSLIASEECEVFEVHVYNIALCLSGQPIAFADVTQVSRGSSSASLLELGSQRRQQRGAPLASAGPRASDHDEGSSESWGSRGLQKIRSVDIQLPTRPTPRGGGDVAVQKPPTKPKRGGLLSSTYSRTCVRKDREMAVAGAAERMEGLGLDSRTALGSTLRTASFKAAQGTSSRPQASPPSSTRGGGLRSHRAAGHARHTTGSEVHTSDTAEETTALRKSAAHSRYTKSSPRLPSLMAP
jgi:hypothetical protein